MAQINQQAPEPPRQKASGSLAAKTLLAAMVAWSAAICPTSTLAQTAPTPDTQSATDKLLQQFNRRLDEQDAEIRDLKAKLAAQPATTATTRPASTPTTAPASGPSNIEKQVATQGRQIAALQRSVSVLGSEQNTGPTYPTLQFHGFGDIDYHASSNGKAEKNSFLLGEFDIFLGSQLSPSLDVMSETVISADNTNTDSIEIERLLLEWSPSDYFNVGIGRFHTAVGYYNTTYHHGTWFQTATNRPPIDEFEDSGGIIPAHSVGITIHGNVPGNLAKKLGLGYFIEVGNGHQYEAPGSPNNSVTNVLDENSDKAFNLAMISRPQAVPGLEVGAGVYYDTITPNSVDVNHAGPIGIRRTNEALIHAHVVYNNASWEFMSEAYAINHQEAHGPNVWSSAGFVQLGRKFGDLTPYARFTYFNGDMADPIYQLTRQVGRHYGPSVGVRYDVSTFVAMKLQYDYRVNSASGVALTLPFEQIPSGSYSEVEFQIAFTY